MNSGQDLCQTHLCIICFFCDVFIAKKKKKEFCRQLSKIGLRPVENLFPYCSSCYKKNWTEKNRHRHMNLITRNQIVNGQSLIFMRQNTVYACNVVRFILHPRIITVIFDQAFALRWSLCYFFSTSYFVQVTQ